MSFEQAAISSIRNNRALRRNRPNRKEMLQGKLVKRFCPSLKESSKIKFAKEKLHATWRAELFYLFIGTSIFAVGFIYWIAKLIG